MTCRVVVLVSGSGTLLQALLDETRSVDHPVTVVAVGADREGTGGVSPIASRGVMRWRQRWPRTSPTGCSVRA